MMSKELTLADSEKRDWKIIQKQLTEDSYEYSLLSLKERRKSL
jgi:hypothetical protein